MELVRVLSYHYKDWEVLQFLVFKQWPRKVNDINQIDRNQYWRYIIQPESGSLRAVKPVSEHGFLTLFIRWRSLVWLDQLKISIEREENALWMNTAFMSIIHDFHVFFQQKSYNYHPFWLINNNLKTICFLILTKMSSKRFHLLIII